MCCMNKEYNNMDNFASKFTEFLKNSIPNIRKTQLNILPYIILGMILSESCSAPDIAKSLKSSFPFIKHDSLIKRIRRFFSNRLFDPYVFYHKLIIHIISTYSKKHQDKRVHITFDHMFSKSNYTVFMITMRVGTQGIPLWFKCFKDISDNDAFKFETLKEGIKSVSDLFKDTDFDLIFLADRWFHSPKILGLIDSLGHTYCVRLKGNIIVYQNDIKMKAKKLKHKKYHSVSHKNVLITKERFKTNIVYSSTEDTKDPWIIVTNGDTTRAIKDYSYRFGSIECVFKNQKSNGFNLEKISNSDIKSFEVMYTLVCTCVTYLTILGADYSKNPKCYKKVKFETHKTYIIDGKKIRKRTVSLFKAGLTLFKLAISSFSYVRLPVNFKLYDI